MQMDAYTYFTSKIGDVKNIACPENGNRQKQRKRGSDCEEEIETESGESDDSCAEDSVQL
jgi:hypothetical protein